MCITKITWTFFAKSKLKYRCINALIYVTKSCKKFTKTTNQNLRYRKKQHNVYVHVSMTFSLSVTRIPLNYIHTCAEFEGNSLFWRNRV